MTVSAWVAPRRSVLVAGVTAIESARNGETETAVVAVLPDGGVRRRDGRVAGRDCSHVPGAGIDVATAGADDAKVEPKVTT